MEVLAIISIILSIISIVINGYTITKTYKKYVQRNKNVSYKELYNYKNQKVKLKK